MSAYYPQRTFNGVPGDPSVDLGGPDELEKNIDELCKMFDPNATHGDGTPGGLSPENFLGGELDASGVTVEPIQGLSGNNLQSMLESVKGLIDQNESEANAGLANRYTKAEADERFAFKGEGQQWSTLAESYAKGGTGTRAGENTDNSKYYKEQSANSATASAQSASAAASSANTASGYANTALGYKNDASNSATAAANSASTALGYKNDASNSANAAASSASTASGYANTALGYKNAASSSADAAAASAQEAASYIEGSDVTDAVRWDVTQSLTDAGKDRARKNIGIKGLSANKSATAGSVVTFDDGADNIPLKDLKVNLAINQPLHGQANPYPAGGGKNLLPITLAGIKTLNTSGTWSGNAYTHNGVVFTINLDNATNITGINVNGTASGGNASLVLVDNFSNYSSGDIINGCPAGGATNTYKLSFFGSGTSVEDVGAGKTINSTALTTVAIIVYSGVSISNKVFYPMIRLATDTDATFAPYSNICPIYPVTEAEVSRTGKNLFRAILGQTINENTGEFIVTDNVRWRTGLVPVSGGSAITLSIVDKSTMTNGSIVLHQYDENKQQIDVVLLGYFSSATVYTRTLNAQTKYIALNGYQSGGASGILTAKIQLENGSTATTYEPYGQQYLVNIGINQWDEEWEVGGLDITTGQPNAAGGIRSKNFIRVTEGTQYSVVVPSLGSIRGIWYDSAQAFISATAYLSNGQVITAPANAAYFKFFTPISTGSTYGNNISINYPSRFTSYYPYTGNVVYGGELDVTTGVLTAKYVALDLGTKDYSKGGTYDNMFYSRATDLGINWPATDWDVGNVYCSSYNPISYANLNVNNDTLKGVALRQSDKTIRIKDSNYTTESTIKTALAGVQLVYKLATPISIQLTPTEVDTLRGDNVIFCDAGDITNCEYRAEGLIDDVIAGELYEALRNTESEGITVDSALSATSENPVQNKVINTALGAKADLASPTFTGTPKAPTVGSSTNNDQIATTAFVQTLIAGRQAKAGTRTPSLTLTATSTSTGWNNNSQTVNVSGVLANNLIIVSPAPASAKAYADAGIICTAQSAGQLTFTCETVPSVAIDLNVVIFN